MTVRTNYNTGQVFCDATRVEIVDVVTYNDPMPPTTYKREKPCPVHSGGLHRCEGELRHDHPHVCRCNLVWRVPCGSSNPMNLWTIDFDEPRE